MLTPSVDSGAPVGSAAGHNEPSRVPSLTRRRRVLAATTVLSLVVVAAGIAAATRIKSPAQIAAETQPPPPTLLTAPVERTVVKRTLVLRGTVTSEHSFDITPATAQGAQSMILTGIRKPPGATAQPGEVLLEVSGRPLFTLVGAVPAYRDLRPGHEGRDVTQLQEALAALGISVAPDRTGYFGEGTKRGVRELYERLGYEPADTGGADRTDDETLLGAREAVTQARRQVEDLRAQLAAAGPEEAAALRRRLRYAREDLDLAKDRHDRLVERTGPMVPVSEVAFLPTFPARMVTVNARVGEPVRSPLASVAAGQLIVDGQLDPVDGGLVRAGMSVEIEAEAAAGVRAAGTVAAVGALVADTPSRPGGDQQQQQPLAGTYLPVTVRPSQPLSPSLIGHNVRVTVESARSDGPVLAVPQGAVVAAADGDTYVTKVERGSLIRVPVVVGLSGGGVVGVTPTSGTLAAGDEVVIGE